MWCPISSMWWFISSMWWSISSTWCPRSLFTEGHTHPLVHSFSSLQAFGRKVSYPFSSHSPPQRKGNDPCSSSTQNETFYCRLKLKGTVSQNCQPFFLKIKKLPGPHMNIFVKFWVCLVGYTTDKKGTHLPLPP